MLLIIVHNVDLNILNLDFNIQQNIILFLEFHLLFLNYIIYLINLIIVSIISMELNHNLIDNLQILIIFYLLAILV
jgi:hypothetical protein